MVDCEVIILDVFGCVAGHASIGILSVEVWVIVNGSFNHLMLVLHPLELLDVLLLHLKHHPLLMIQSRYSLLCKIVPLSMLLPLFLGIIWSGWHQTQQEIQVLTVYLVPSFLLHDLIRGFLDDGPLPFALDLILRHLRLFEDTIVKFNVNSSRWSLKKWMTIWPILTFRCFLNPLGKVLIFPLHKV